MDSPVVRMDLEASSEELLQLYNQPHNGKFHAQDIFTIVLKISKMVFKSFDIVCVKHIPYFFLYSNYEYDILSAKINRGDSIYLFFKFSGQMKLHVYINQGHVTVHGKYSIIFFYNSQITELFDYTIFFAYILITKSCMYVISVSYPSLTIHTIII